MIFYDTSWAARRAAQFDEITNVEMRENRLSKFSLLYQTASKGPAMETQDEAPFVVSIPPRDTVLKLLKENVMVVRAHKENGELMELKCTLRADMMPNSTKARPTLAEVIMSPNPLTALSHKSASAESNLITVWSVDRHVWRSFRYERLIHITRA